MELQVKDSKGKVVGSIAASDHVWGAVNNDALLHQAVVTQLANKRRGTQNTQTRANVSFSTKKIRPQKELVLLDKAVDGPQFGLVVEWLMARTRGVIGKDFPRRCAVKPSELLFRTKYDKKGSQFLMASSLMCQRAAPYVT